MNKGKIEDSMKREPENIKKAITRRQKSEGRSQKAEVSTAY